MAHALSPVQSPPKGVTIPYRPKPSGSPVIFAGGQVHTALQRDTGVTFVHDALEGCMLLTAFERLSV